MKKSIFKIGQFFLLAAGLLAVMSACKKDSGTSELRAVMNDFASSNQKAYIDNEKYSCFIIGEKMRVNSSTGTVTALQRNNRQCTIDGVVQDNDYKAFYPYHLLVDSASVDLSSGSGLEGKGVFFPQEQVYRTDASGRQIIDNPMIAELSGFGSSNNTLHFRNLCALLKITVCTSDAFDAIHVTFGSNNSNHYKLWGSGKISGDSVLMNGNNGDRRCTVILRFPALHYGSPVGEDFYIMIPSVKLNDGESVTVDIMKGTSSVKKYTHTLPANTSVTLRYNRIHKLGVFTFNASMFSVAANRKVVFSPGNLQWSYTGGGSTPTTHDIKGTGYDKGTWRFAPNQYDIIGAGNNNAHGVLVPANNPKYNNTYDSRYEGWIDLFAWGACGLGDTRPYYYNSPNTNYYINDNANKLGSYDWGAFNVIYNPKTDNDDPYGTWRVLTKEELEYLLHFSGVADGRDNGWCRFNTVYFTLPGGGVINGLIIYPDNISTADKPSFIANVNDEHTSYSISFAQFEQLEGIGCAFLPNAGCIQISLYSIPEIIEAGVHGFYWTSQGHIAANSTVTCPYYLYINQGGSIPELLDDGLYNRGYLRSVRLARDVK